MGKHIIYSPNGSTEIIDVPDELENIPEFIQYPPSLEERLEAIESALLAQLLGG